MDYHTPHRRRSIRLKGFDYTSCGAYFITTVTKERLCILGEIQSGQVRLSRLGLIVLHAWQDLPNHYPHLLLDEFCIMPNHLHAILLLTDRRGGSAHASTLLKNVTQSGLAAPLAPHQDPPLQGSAHGSTLLKNVTQSGLAIPLAPLEDPPLPAHPAPPAAYQTRPRHGIPEIVRAFKSFSARRINATRGTTGSPVWQRNYYEHIICDQADWERIRQYIRQNPAQWSQDQENPHQPENPPRVST